MIKAVAVRPARRRVEIVERERPELRAGDDARIRVLDVGVCGTDAEICAFDYGGAPPEGEDDLIVGHEALGQMVETGPEVTGLRPGDLVVPMLFVFTGVPGRKHRVTIAGDAIMRSLVLRNQTVLGTVNAGRPDYEAAVRDLARMRERWPGLLEALITGRWPMERFCERAGATEGIKDVISVGVAA